MKTLQEREDEYFTNIYMNVVIISEETERNIFKGGVIAGSTDHHAKVLEVIDGYFRDVQVIEDLDVPELITKLNELIK